MQKWLIAQFGRYGINQGWQTAKRQIALPLRVISAYSTNQVLTTVLFLSSCSDQ